MARHSGSFLPGEDSRRDISSLRAKELVKIGSTGTITLGLHRGQTRAWDSKVRFVFVISGHQAGKRLAIDTPIPTPDGFVPMGNINPGDTVYDEHGKQCMVIGVSDIEYGDCYKVTFDDGSEIIADGDHQWLTQTRAQRKNEARHSFSEKTPWLIKERIPTSSIVTTREIARTLTVRNGKKRIHNYSIPLVGPVQYPKRKLPIPPYTFGAWLGDGNSSSPAITNHPRDYHIIERIEREGINVHKRKTRKDRTQSYALRIGPRGQRTGILRDLGVLNNKHIPEIYLVSSANQRLELLRGLMDTDGCCQPRGRGARCEFTSTTERLAHGVLELCRSLGIKARLKTGRAMLHGRDCGPKYRVTFTTSIRVFHLPRKAALLPTSTRPDTKRRFFVSVEPIDPVSCKCISVDSPSNLYLAGRDYIITHNTEFAPWWLENEIKDTWTPGGNNDYLAVTSTFDLFKVKFLPAMQKTFCDILDIGRFWAADRIIELRCMDPDDPKFGQFYATKSSDAMWGRIILRSAQSKGGLEAATAKAAVLDECGQDEFSLEAWEAVQRRLSVAQGRVLGTTTPYNLGWLYSNIYVPWKEGRRSDIEVVQFSSIMNPVFPKEEYERAKKVLPSWRFAMFYDGRFERPAGLIYRCITEDTYKPRFPIPKHWRRVVGVDFGGANTALVWLAEDPETGRWWLYDCSLSGHKSTFQHAIDARQKAAGLNVTAYGGARSEGQHRIDWDNEGFTIYEPLTYDLEAGIARVIGLVNSDKLRIFDDLEGLRDEIGSYRRKLDESNNPTEDIISKRNFHRLDALRYAGTYLESGGDTIIMGYNDYMDKYNGR